MKIYIAGHAGLVGSALVRQVENKGVHTWVGKARRELDLLDRSKVFEYVKKENPDWVILAAAKVGGIGANAQLPVEFLSENLQIQTNVLDACYANNVKRVLFLGSSCIYPKYANQPIPESALLTGALEETNEAYAIAKIAGLKLINAYRNEYGCNWISAMPTNLYGAFDNFDPNTSHVIPGLINKFTKAAESGADSVSLWGTGSPLREFLHVDDLADACIFLLENYDGDLPINVGTGQELTIRELAYKIMTATGFKGQILWDESKPDGTPRKLLDSSVLKKLGWTPRISLDSGIEQTVKWYLANSN